MLKYLRETPDAHPITEFPILLFLELVLARGQGRGSPSQFIPPEVVERVLQGVYALWTVLCEHDDPTILENPAGVAAALCERSTLGKPMLALRVAFALWVWEHKDLDERARESRALFGQCLRETYGIALNEWVAGIAIATHASTNQPVKEVTTEPLYVNPRRPELTEQGVSLLEQCLKLVSACTERLAAECKAWDDERDLVVEPTLLPLKKFPSLATLESPPRYRVTTPVLLAGAAVSRPFVVAQDTRRPDVRKSYGYVVEGMVHGVMRECFGDNYQRLEEPGDRKTGEGIIWFRDGCIVVEVKARHRFESKRFGIRSDQQLRDDLSTSDLPKAVEQIRATTNALLDGSVPGSSLRTIRVIGSIVVMVEEVALTAASKSVLDTMLPATKSHAGALCLRPQLLTLDGVVDLLHWDLTSSMLGVLTVKMQHPDLSLEHLGNYLRIGRHPRRPPEVRTAPGKGIVDLVRPYFRPQAGGDPRA